MPLTLRPREECKYDVVSLGECMIRLSPPARDRIEFADHLEIWVGGGEYNVAYGLARLGLRAAWIGGLNDTPVAGLIRNHARAAGVDVAHAVEKPYDGVGREHRIGLNFTEVGSGRRPSSTLYDRGHSASTAIEPADVDWKRLFHDEGVRWFHTGGVFTALSDSTRRTVAEAVRAAKEAGTVVSYDLNFRAALWSAQQALDATRPLVPFMDCILGKDETFERVLGFVGEHGGMDKGGQLDRAGLQRVMQRIAEAHPNVSNIASTLRRVKTAAINDWGATMWHEGDLYDARDMNDLELEDRVGGGDGFAAGLIYGLLDGRDPRAAIDLGVAYGALLMSTRGDTSQTTLDELLHVSAGGSARIKR